MMGDKGRDGVDYGLEVPHLLRLYGALNHCVRLNPKKSHRHPHTETKAPVVKYKQQGKLVSHFVTSRVSGIRKLVKRHTHARWRESSSSCYFNLGNQLPKNRARS